MNPDFRWRKNNSFCIFMQTQLMRLLSKPVGFVVLVIAAFVVGFFFLLKGCLAHYDERFAHTPPLYFEKDGKALVLSLVEYQKASSYSSQNGVTRKSVITSYYIQTNDATTAEVVLKKKIK